MRSSGKSPRISSRSPSSSSSHSPSPSPTFKQKSPKDSEKLTRSPSVVDDKISSERFFGFIRYLGKHVFIVVLSIIFGIYSGLSLSPPFPFFGRVLLLALTLYGINFIFYKKGAQVITETFFTAFIVISGTYFIVSCPNSHFIPSLLLMVFCSYLYYLL